MRSECYFCQIADVVLPAGATTNTIFWLRTVEMDDFCIVSLLLFLRTRKFDKGLCKAMVH